MRPTLKEIENSYNIIKVIIDKLIIDNNIIFSVAEVAPSTFKAMKMYYEGTGELLIYNGGDHGYLGYEYNIKFRALHDFMHLKNDLKFTFKDEKILSDITADLFKDIAYSNLECTHFEIGLVSNIISGEIRGQIEYYENNNKYVKNQVNFINNYLRAA